MGPRDALVPTSVPEDVEVPPAEAFLTDLVRALAAAGHPSHRLEAAVATAARTLGVELVVMAQPTSVLLGFGPAVRTRVVLVRLSPGSVHLGRLAALDALLTNVVAGHLPLGVARHRLAAILRQEPRWVPGADLLAHALAPASGAVLFGGGVEDVGWCAAAGLAVGLLDRLGGRVEVVGRGFLVLGALTVTVLASVAAGMTLGAHAGIIALAGVIVLLPGLSFTVSLVELASGHLASGTGRLAGAAVTLLQIIVGVALGHALLPIPVTSGAATPVPPGATGPAIAAAAVAFAILLRARPIDLVTILPACFLAYGASSRGVAWFGPEVGAGVGAFVLALAADVYGLLARRTVAVPLVPGVLLLVPGSLGYRSLSALLSGEVVFGVEQLFTMGIVGTSLAAGLILAHAVAAPRSGIHF